jgi:hypothetical protein
MTASNFVNPTYYNLQRAVIRSEYSNIGELDITALIPRLSISVSIDSETIFGSARIVDSVGLLDGSDTRDSLRGEEQIILEIADSKSINENGGAESGEIENPFRFVGFVYKVDNIETKEVNDAVMYDIHFISYQSFKAGTYEIIRAFIDETVSDIAKTIFEEYYEQPQDLKEIKDPADRKRLFIEDTEGVYRCTIPKMRPEEAMGFLTKRSYSTRSPSCMFRFFENTRGYHYVTDEQLYRLATDTAEPDYDPSRMFRFTYLDAIPNTLDFFDQQLNNLESIENSKRVNSLDDIYNGAYRNKVYEIDILSRNLNLLDDKNQYDYFERREKYNLRSIPEFNRLADRHTKDFIETIHRGSEDVQKQWLVIQNYTDGEKTGENAMQAQTYYAEIISNRAAYSKHLESITVNASGPGRLDITAGDIVDLKVEDFVFADSTEAGDFETNKHLSGKYIVRSVTHSMEYEEMINSYVLIKREWSQTELDIESTRIFAGGR